MNVRAHKVITDWANNDFNKESFRSLFNIQVPTSRFIDESIDMLSSLANDYRNYILEIRASTIADKNAHQKSSLLYTDIFADLCIIIKLASEGYIDQSLRVLRGTLDTFTLSIFSIASWDDPSKESKNGVNPFVMAYDYGTWPYLLELTPMEYYYRGTFLGEVGSERELRSAEDLVFSEARRVYKRLSGKDVKVDKLSSEEERSFESIESGIAEALVISLKNTGKRWEHKEGGTWAFHKKEIQQLFYFWKVYTHSRSLTWHACKKHKDELLQTIEREFHQFDPRLDKESLSGVVFVTSGGNSDHSFCPYCTGRRARSRLFALRSRPTNRLMLELSREWLPKRLVQEMDNLLKDNFNFKHGFDRFMQVRLFYPLNRYVHGDLVDEPDIDTWFHDYLYPVIRLAGYVLKGFTDLMHRSVNPD